MKLSTIMKKGIAIGVVGAMVAGLAACGGNDANNNASANNEANSSGSGVTLQFQQWWGVEMTQESKLNCCPIRTLIQKISFSTEHLQVQWLM